MRAGPVIVNNTPLVALWTLARLDLLRELYGEVWILRCGLEYNPSILKTKKQGCLGRPTQALIVLTTAAMVVTVIIATLTRV